MPGVFSVEMPALTPTYVNRFDGVAPMLAFQPKKGPVSVYIIILVAVISKTSSKTAYTESVAGGKCGRHFGSQCLI